MKQAVFALLLPNKERVASTFSAGRLHQRTLHAGQQCPHKTRPSFWRGHPKPVLPRRIMSNMLAMTAGQIGHPVALGIQVKPRHRSKLNQGLRVRP